MNRQTTNIFRFILDEILPPIIRDNRIFMYPLFYYWFKGKNISLMMDFKKKILTLSEDELATIYRQLDCRAKDRNSDLSDNTLEQIFVKMNPNSKNVIDVGCGNGYLLNKMDNSIKKFGCDILDHNQIEDNNKYKYYQYDINNLNFKNNSFDTVICTHTIEHIPKINLAINELIRIAKKEIIIVVPKQKYYYYTMDLHLHFFPDQFSLINLIGLKKYKIYEIDGDWLYIGFKN